MNMFARFDENPAMTLQDIKETKHYGRTDGRTDTQCENRLPTTKLGGGGGGGYNHQGVIYAFQSFMANGIGLVLKRSLLLDLYNLVWQ